MSKQSMKKSDLFKEDLLTIILVLSLVFYDDIRKEWEEWQETRKQPILQGQKTRKHSI